MGRAEVPHRHAAHAIVVWRVGRDHTPRRTVRLYQIGLGPGLGCPLGRRETVTYVGAHPGVVGQRHELLVPRDGVDAVHHPRHRRLSELVEERVRVGAVFVLHSLRPGLFWCHDVSPLSNFLRFARFNFTLLFASSTPSAAWRLELGAPICRVMPGQDNGGKRRRCARIRELGRDRLHVGRLIGSPTAGGGNGADCAIIAS